MNFTLELSKSPYAINDSLYKPISSCIYLTSYVINIVFGLPVNSYVLWLICTGKGSGIVAEFFSLNLIICQLVYCLGTFVFLPASQFPELNNVAYFLVALPNAGRPLFNSMICIERYLAVLHPVLFLKCKPLRYRLACSAVIWMTTLTYCVYSLSVLTFNRKYLFLCAYLPLHFLLLSVKLFCCFAILRALKCPGPGEKIKEKEEANHMKKKAMTFIMIITVAMFFQYIPLFSIGVLYKTVSRAQFDLLWCIGFVIFLLLGFVSPFLYIYRVGSLS